LAFVADQELCDFVWGSDCGGQAYRLEVSADEAADSLHRQRQLASAFAVCQFMDFVDYDPSEALNVLPKDPAGQHSLQGLGRGDEYVWWAAGLPRAFFQVCVAMAYCEFYVEVVAPPLQPFEHISVQSAQWRDVEDFYSGRFGRLEQHAENWEEGGFGLARGCRRNQEDVFAFEDFGDGFFLRLRRFGEAFLLD
jgi:hypothetical protein